VLIGVSKVYIGDLVSIGYGAHEKTLFR